MQDRTEPATPRRRREERERGNIPRSADLSTAAVLLASVVALELLGPRLFRGLSGVTSGVLGRLGGLDGEGMDLAAAFGAEVAAAGLALLPILMIIAAAAVAVNLAQSGFLFTGHLLAPDLSRLDPVQGARRLVSGRAAMRLLMGLLKLATVCGVVILTIWAGREQLFGLAAGPFEEVVPVGAAAAMSLALRAALALAALAVLDYAWQRWQYERDIRMTKQEVREELRRYEGDPKARERRRAVQKQIAMQEMVRRVPGAAVVVLDPASFAVALAYDRDRMEAPVVVANGGERLARRIHEAALEHGVPVVERPELARALGGVEAGRAIPAGHYDAVAEVLAYAIRLRGKAEAV
jgi:flagellar biosynthetic protein FlhB